MKNQEKLKEFYDSLCPKIKTIIGQIIKAEAEGQGKIKLKIRKILEKEAGHRET